MRKVKRNVLLNPGPATTTDTVKYAQVVPDICPRERGFGDLMAWISTELARFVGDPARYATVLFAGSGTAAVEAIISSVIARGPVLIVNNGPYGERMCRMARIYRIPVVEVRQPGVEPLDLRAIGRALRRTKPTHVAVVHNETSTGLLADVPGLGRLCRRHGAELIVDAMSSYAAVPIRMREMNIAYLAASANKNLQGMAGVSFVIAKRSALERARAIPPRNLYLNLPAQHDAFERTHQMRFTPPVQTLYALKQAIVEARRETIEGRYARYTRSWKTLVAGLKRLGLEFVVPPEHHSRIITAIREPDRPDYRFEDLHDFLFARGFTIYPGKVGDLKTFRVANIGAIDHRDIRRFLALLERYPGMKRPGSPSHARGH